MLDRTTWQQAVGNRLLKKACLQRTLLKLLRTLELQLGSPRVFVGERDQLPQLAPNRLLKDVKVLVVS